MNIIDRDERSNLNERKIPQAVHRALGGMWLPCFTGEEPPVIAVSISVAWDPH